MTHHSSITSLQLKLSDTNINPGEKYHHYRDATKLYEIICCGLNEADELPVVVYKSLSDGLVWVRKLSVWCEMVDHCGMLVPRFTKVV